MRFPGPTHRVVGFEDVRTARAFLDDLRERLAKFGLTLHPDKTRWIEFGRFAAERRRARGQGRPETFDFLGFTHCCGTDLKGKFQVVRLTAKKRMRVTMTAIRQKLFQRRHEPVPVVGRSLQRVLNGYFAYHAVPTNLLRLDGSVARSAAHGGMPCCEEVNGTGSTGPDSIASPVSTSRPAGFCIPIRRSASSRYDLRQEPYAVTLHVRICAGGGQQWLSLPRPNLGQPESSNTFKQVIYYAF